MGDRYSVPAVADVLNGAADLIERDGWTKGRYADEFGYCIAGAIDVAAGCFDEQLTQEALQARRAVADVVARNPRKWNDAPGRTKAEVVAALRAAATRAGQ